jgi:hypothetical protein
MTGALKYGEMQQPGDRAMTEGVAGGSYIDSRLLVIDRARRGHNQASGFVNGGLSERAWVQKQSASYRER